eukprot:CAMPEP_0185752078 /NCGR_PEP_ID=MMETSP1174-20130828/10868_1 /TAXON_ID=35687 /ORGANISM="Dictyocha speculum, Strain CCMP1381" /LENGTH=544 /DNA_ID=CAMNT_0028429353 /DNA_START=106 /DNA_END=1736 /DNA_ORIENTATION=+
MSEIAIFGSFLDDTNGIYSPASVTADYSSCLVGEYGDCQCDDSLYCSCTPASCTKCEPGKYSNVSGATSEATCVSCEAGTYSSYLGATECFACGFGYYSTTEEESNTDGFGAASDATICVICPAGKYQGDNSDGYYCDSCESAKWSRQGAAECKHCQPGYYRGEDGTCESCPSEGAICTAFTTTQGIVVQKGYYRFAPNSSIIYKCRYSTACTSNSNETGDSMCRDKNGKGPLCAYCGDGFYIDASTRTCVACSRDWADYSIYLVFGGIFIVVICLAVICFNNSYSRAVITSLVGARCRQCFECLEGLWGRFFAILATADKSPFQILWFFFQTSAQFVNKYDEVRYPQPFKGLIAILQLLTIDFTSFPTICIEANFYAVLLFTIFWWPMIAGLAFLLYFTARNFSGDSRRTREVIYACVVFILILFHSSIVTVIFKTFDCTEEYDAEGSEYDDGDGTTRFLIADMTLSCDGSTHKSYESVAYVAIAFYVVLVPLFFVLALRNRHIYPELAKPLNFLVREVRLEVWWYEVVALVWRFVITGVLLL